MNYGDEDVAKYDFKNMTTEELRSYVLNHHTLMTKETLQKARAELKSRKN
jgi:hypothetical protein